MKKGIPVYGFDGADSEKIVMPVLCTFTFWDKLYLLTTEKEGEYSCYMLKWNPLFGYSLGYGDDFTEACKAADILLERSDCAPEKFPLNGEHYIITPEEKGMRIRRRKAHFLTKTNAHILTYICQIIAAAALAAGYVWLFLLHPGISVPAAVFPSMARLEVIRLMYIIGISGSLLLLLCRKGLHDAFDLFFVVVIPMNIISAIALCHSNNIICIIITALSIIILCPYVIAFVYRLIKRRRKRNIIKSANKALRVVFALLCVVTVTAMTCTSLFNVQVYISKSDDTSENREDIIKAYAAACRDIEAQKWKTLDPDKRLNVLQAIIDFESVYVLGIEPPKLLSGVPKYEMTIGFYNHPTNSIVIEKNHLAEDSAVSVVNTVLHETRHAYQKAAVSLYDKLENQLDASERRITFFRDADKFRESFDNYKGGEKDYSEYSSQYVEKDSRSYAQYRIVEVYADYIYPELKTKSKAKAGASSAT